MKGYLARLAAAADSGLRAFRMAGQARADAMTKTDPYAGFSDDDFMNLALRRVERFHTSESWAGGTVERCDATIVRIAQLRLEYSTIQPPRLRSAMMDWLDYFEREARSDRADVISGASRRELDEYHAKASAERERTNELAEVIKRQLGTPPSA